MTDDMANIETDDEYYTEQYFNKERNLTLIDLFKKYKPMVESGAIKTMKIMWQLVASEMSRLHQIEITAAKCENRFRVLNRAFKRAERERSSGIRGRKGFQFYEEFKEVYSKTRKYALVDGLKPSNYADYTTTDFGNIVPELTPEQTIQSIKVDPTTYSLDDEIVQNEEEVQTEPVRKSNMPFLNFFDTDQTFALIRLYKEYDQKMCEGSVPTRKIMWDLIAKDLTALYKCKISASKCENKFRVLERNYKRGNPEKRDEFREVLKDILGEAAPKKMKIEQACQTTPQQVTIRVVDPQQTQMGKIENVLLGIRSDFQQYYKEMLDIERQKLSLKRERILFEKEQVMKRERVLLEKEQAKLEAERNKTMNILVSTRQDINQSQTNVLQ